MLVEINSSEGQHSAHCFLIKVFIIISKHINSHGYFQAKGATLAFGVGTVAIADPALGVPHRATGHVLHEFAEHLRPLLPAGGVGDDVSIAGEIEDGRKQT